MGNKVHRTIDGHRLLIKVVSPTGKLIGERLYCDRRCGITWPSSQTPGYACIFGLYDEPPPRRLRLIWEYSSDDRGDLIQRITLFCQHLGCRWLLADLSDAFHPYERAFYNYCRVRNIKGLALFDVADISGLVRARPVIDDMFKLRLLRMSRRSILQAQISGLSADIAMTAVDGIKPEQRWYAVNALGNVVCSYDHWPWQMPKKATPRNAGKRAGYG